MKLKELLETLDYEYQVESIGLHNYINNKLLTKKVDANPSEVLHYSDCEVVKWHPAIFDTKKTDIYGNEYDAKFIRLCIYVKVEDK